MKKYKIHLIIAGIIAMLALIFFPLKAYYQYLKEPVAALTDAIPPETAIIIKTESTDKLLGLLSSSEIFEILENNKSKYGIKCLSDKVNELRSKSNKFSDIIANSEIMICMVPDKDMNPENVLLVNIGKISASGFADQVKKILPANARIEKYRNSPAGLYRITEGSNEIWFYVYRGILAISYNRDVLALSCKTAGQRRNLINDNAFSKLLKSTGKRVDGILMINNKKLISSFLQTDNENPLEFDQSPFDGWISLDLHIENDRVLMDGFMAAETDSTLLTGQQPVDLQHLEYFPANTAFAATISLSDQELFCSKLSNSDTIRFSGYDSANQISSDEIFRWKEHLASWAGNSVSFVAPPSFFAGNRNDYLIMIGLKNPDSARQLLQPFIKPFEREIKTLTAGNFAAKLWGNIFSIQGEQYCLITNQMLIISPSSGLLEYYVHESIADRLLGSTGLYEKAKAYLLDQSSISIYMIPSFCRNFDGIHSRSSFKSSVSQKWAGVPASTGLLCMQISAGNPLYFTHAFALFDPDVRALAQKTDTEAFSSGNLNEAPEVQSDLRINESESSVKKQQGVQGIGKLFLVSGDRLNNDKLFGSKKNTLIAFDKQGGINWTFECKAEPFGNIHEINVNGLKGEQYLIAAGTYLHIVDGQGKEVKNSPIKLPGGIKGNFSVFDYDQKHDYRILYAGNDNQLHNITLNSKELAEWQKPKLQSDLNSLQFFRTSGKDFIVVSDGKGRLSVLDRRGRTRVTVSKDFTKSKGSEVFENKTNSKGLFLMASMTGNLAYIDGNGLVTESQFGEHGQNPWFDYIDFNGDGKNDFIFCGNGKVTVYNKMKEVLASAKLSNATFSKPFIYSSGKESWLAVRDVRSGKVLAFNNKNQHLSSMGINSETDPVIIRPEGNKKPVLVTVVNGKALFTPLE